MKSTTLTAIDDVIEKIAKQIANEAENYDEHIAEKIEALASLIQARASIGY